MPDTYLIVRSGDYVAMSTVIILRGGPPRSSAMAYLAHPGSYFSLDRKDCLLWMPDKYPEPKYRRVIGGLARYAAIPELGIS